MYITQRTKGFVLLNEFYYLTSPITYIGISKNIANVKIVEMESCVLLTLIVSTLHRA